MFLPTEQNHWIGLNDLASPGIWRWQNSFVIPNYTNWYRSDPNLFSACVLIGPHWPDLQWVDEPCSETTIWLGTHIHAFCEADNKNT